MDNIVGEVMIIENSFDYSADTSQQRNSVEKENEEFFQEDIVNEDYIASEVEDLSDDISDDNIEKAIDNVQHTLQQ